jgi:hypothetical protein
MSLQRFEAVTGGICFSILFGAALFAVLFL